MTAASIFAAMDSRRSRLAGLRQSPTAPWKLPALAGPGPLACHELPTSVERGPSRCLMPGFFAAVFYELEVRWLFDILHQ
jgi:hypothetical protein